MHFLKNKDMQSEYRNALFSLPFSEKGQVQETFSPFLPLPFVLL